MGYASRAGRARTRASSPQAHAICDRCGFRYNNVDLRFQWDYRGPTLQNTRILVCDRCLDVPQDQLRSIILPPDPQPVANARVEPFSADEIGVGPNGQVVGFPMGLDFNAQMPLVADTQWAVPVPVVSVSSLGTSTITVTTSPAHGLSTNAQIAVQGLSNVNACGFFSITVVNAVTFSYVALAVVPAGSLLTGTTVMVTVNVGLPYGQTTIPQGSS